MNSNSFIFVMVVLVAAGCHRPREKAPDEADMKPTQTNQVTLPQSQSVSLNVAPALTCTSSVTHLNGRLAWDEDVTVRVFTPFAGRVTRLLTEVGQKIGRDGALAAIISPDYGQAQADARRASSDFVLAQRNLSRLHDLFAHGAAAQKDVQAAEAEFERAQAESLRTSARLSFYGGSSNTIDQTFILKSPLEGVVVERNINPGQEVRPDAMLANSSQFFAPLFVVTDPMRLWVQLDATEQDLPQLKPGQEVVVHSRAYPGQSFPGRIEAVSDFLDPTTRTIKVRGSLPNPERLLKAEMFVSVDLPSQTAVAGLDVPAKAVFSKGDRRFVFLEESPGRYARREVKVGPDHEGKILVLDGLSPGARVVTDGCLLLDHMLEASAGS